MKRILTALGITLLGVTAASAAVTPYDRYVNAVVENGGGIDTGTPVVVKNYSQITGPSGTFTPGGHATLTVFHDHPAPWTEAGHHYAKA